MNGIMLAVELGIKGMAGIFAVLGTLAVTVWLLGLWDKKTQG